MTERNIPYEVTEHKAVFNMEVITVKGDKRVDLKEFRRLYGLRALSFASADDLLHIMGLTAGSVTPLGLLNDAEHRIHFSPRTFIGARRFFMGG